MSKYTALFVGLVFGSAITALVVLYFLPSISLGLISAECGGDCSDNDAIAIAASIGRLDIVSFALAIVGLGVAAFAIWGFVAIRDTAERTAKHTADKVATAIVADKTEIFVRQINYALKARGLNINVESVVDPSAMAPEYDIKSVDESKAKTFEQKP